MGRRGVGAAATQPNRGDSVNPRHHRPLAKVSMRVQPSCMHACDGAACPPLLCAAANRRQTSQPSGSRNSVGSLHRPGGMLRLTVEAVWSAPRCCSGRHAAHSAIAPDACMLAHVATATAWQLCEHARLGWHVAVCALTAPPLHLCCSAITMTSSDTESRWQTPCTLHGARPHHTCMRPMMKLPFLLA